MASKLWTPSVTYTTYRVFDQEGTTEQGNDFEMVTDLHSQNITKAGST